MTVSDRLTPDREAPTTLEPGEVVYETFDLWGIRNDERGNVILTSRERVHAERQLQNVVAREEGEPHHVLVRQRVIRRVEEWREPLEVIPWHEPCEWVGATDEHGLDISPLRCFRHGHDKGEPIAPEYIRGATS